MFEVVITYNWYDLHTKPELELEPESSYAMYQQIKNLLMQFFFFFFANKLIEMIGGLIMLA